MSNPFVVAGADTATPFSGAGLLEDGAQLSSAIAGRDWVGGSLSAVSTVADVAAFAMNPLAGLVSWGVGWLLDHIEPLKSWLNELAGNAGAVQGGSATWGNIAAGLEAATAELTRSLDGTLADARSRATDAYKALMGDVGAHVRMASELAEAIGTGLSVASGIVQFVHDLVRDAISDVVGYAVSCIIPLPNVIASVVAKVWSWVDRIVTKLRDLVRSFSHLDGLFRRVDDLLERLRAVLDRIKHGVLGDQVPGPNPRSRTPSGDELADGPPPGSRNSPERGTEPADRCQAGGEPVDMATGFVFMEQTDVELPGALPVVLRRRYVSGFRHGRSFGRRWASTLDEHIDTAGGRLSLVRWDGSVLLFPLVEVGGRAEPLGGADRWLLTRTGAAEFAVLDPVAGLTYGFAGVGRRKWLVEQRDLAGRWVRFVRTASGVASRVVHHGGYEVVVASHGSRVTGLEVAGAGPDGGPLPMMRFDYAHGSLVAESSTSGATIRYEVDEIDRIVAWSNTNGTRYTHSYDEADRCVHEGTGGPVHDRVYRFSYEYLPGPEPDGHTTVITNPDGTRQRFEVDHRGLVLAQVNQLGERTEHAYDEQCRKIATTDPLGNVTRFGWDEASRLTSLTDPTGATTWIDYDSSGLPVRVVDPTGATTSQSFDDKGRLVERADSTGATELWRYDDEQSRVTWTDPTGRVVAVELDAAGLESAWTDAAGTSRVVRDARGLPVSQVDAVGAVSTFAWSGEGRLVSRTDPDGSAESWEWDGQGNLLAHTDPAGRVARYGYGLFDVVEYITNPDGSTLGLAYDDERRLMAVTNATGLTWHYERDAAGRVVAEVDYDQRRTEYGLDAAGRAVVVTNAAGETVRAEYDRAGRIVARQAGGETTTFGYDAVGRLVTAVSPAGELTRELDPEGRLLAETVGGYTMRWTLDASGRIVERVTPSGVLSDWVLDRAGRRTGLELADQPLRLSRDAVGRGVATEFGSASITSRYDPVGRLTERTLSGVGDAAPSWQVGYGYSPAGELITARDSALGVRDYELDPAGRVLAVAGATTESYRYDPAGNLTSAAWNSGGGSEASGRREYAGTLLTRVGRDHYDYDPAGRLIRRRRHLLSGGVKEWRFAWNPLNQLTQAVTPDGHHWRYSYDPFGRRTGKQHFTAQGELVEEYRFAWDGPVLVEQIHTTPASVTTTTWEHEGLDPIAQTRTIRPVGTGEGSQAEVDAEFNAIITDLVGSPIRMVDTDGNTTWMSRSNLWGLAVADPVMPLRFPGQYHDPETGLHYNLHRYYDPTNARYTTPDPLGLAPSPNPYTYPANPTRQIDPYGLAPQPHQPGNNPPSTGRDLDKPASLRGATPDEIRQLVPSGWVEKPLKKGNGVRFLNPQRPGESISIEAGWPGHTDPLHSGPYVKISRDSTILRVPLQGNPVMRD